jgi:hypothetical protein
MRKRAFSTLFAVRWSVLAALFVVVCLILDFFPYHGPPNFRFNGSDPSFEVWNLGWPLAMAIYDSRSGFHVGPVTIFVLPCQCAVLVLGWFSRLLLRWRTDGK